MAEALRHGRRGQRGQLAERAHAEPLEHLREGVELGPRPQQRDRERREELARLALPDDDRRIAPAPARPRLRGGRVRGEAARRRAQPRAGTERCGPRRARTPSRSPPWMPCRPAASKQASPARSDSTAAPMPSSASSTSLQSARAASGSGGTSRSSGQRASASPRRMPAHDAERLGARGDLPHHLLAPRLGRQRMASSESSSARSPSAANSANRG